MTQSYKWNFILILILKFLYSSIELGVVDDSANLSRLAKLLQFRSSLDKRFVSFADYIESMKDKQKAIYYIAG